MQARVRLNACVALGTRRSCAGWAAGDEPGARPWPRHGYRHLRAAACREANELLEGEPLQPTALEVRDPWEVDAQPPREAKLTGAAEPIEDGTRELLL